MALTDKAAALSRRFLDEACASLPGLLDTIIPSDAFLNGMRLQQLRWRADQQVPGRPV
jgi:hypothetical protein